MHNYNFCNTSILGYRSYIFRPAVTTPVSLCQPGYRNPQSKKWRSEIMQWPTHIRESMNYKFAEWCYDCQCSSASNRFHGISSSFRHDSVMALYTHAPTHALLPETTIHVTQVIFFCYYWRLCRLLHYLFRLYGILCMLSNWARNLTQYAII